MAKKWNTLTITTQEKQADESIRKVIEDATAYLLETLYNNGIPDRGRRFILHVEMKVADNE